MRFTYDQEADAAVLELGESREKISRNEAVMLEGGQVILDITESGNVTSIEVVGASTILGEKTISSLSDLHG